MPAKTPVIRIEHRQARIGTGFKIHYWFRLVSAANNKVLATSEVYTTKSKRDRTAALLAKARLVMV